MLTSETSLLYYPSNASGSDATSSNDNNNNGATPNGTLRKYYFLNTGEGAGAGDTSAPTGQTQAAASGNVLVESIPQGSTSDEFAPRALAPPTTKIGSPKNARKQPAPQRNAAATGVGGAAGHGGTNESGGSGIFSFLLGSGNSNKKKKAYGEVGTLLKQRKAPVKIEPKVFFANERTFLAWMHLSVILAGASIAILAFADTNSNPFSQLYGVILLPVSIAFIVYSMYQYARRASMIRRRHPGPYEDTTGPTVLGIMLMLSILAQFSLKLYEMK